MALAAIAASAALPPCFMMVAAAWDASMWGVTTPALPCDVRVAPSSRSGGLTMRALAGVD